MKIPKPADSIENFEPSTSFRIALQLPDDIFLRSLKTWSSSQQLIQDYFTINAHRPVSATNLYNDILDFLTKITSDSSKAKKGVKTYCTKLRDYYDDKNTKILFYDIYSDESRKVRKDRTAVIMREESQIASNILISQASQETSTAIIQDELHSSTSNKRTYDEATSTDTDTDGIEDALSSNESLSSYSVGESSTSSFLTIKKNNKLYTVHKPSKNLKSPNKPALQREDLDILKEHIDICTSNINNSEHCSAQLRKEYQNLIDEQHKNYALKTVNQNCFDYVVAIINSKSLELLETNVDFMTSDDTFTKFVKYAARDFYINCLRPKPYNINDERTIYCEVVIPLFKIFGNITKDLIHVWCEKSQMESKTLYLSTHDYSLKGFDKKFLDGIATMITPDSRNFIMFESSGYDKTENIEHNIANNIKNIKSATDSLKHLACRYQMASFSTFKKVHVFSLHVIQDTMTLTRFWYKSKLKWEIVECRTCSLPLSFADKKKFLKVMELFAFLFIDMEEQKEILNLINDQCNGILDVDECDTVKTVLN